MVQKKLCICILFKHINHFIKGMQYFSTFFSFQITTCHEIYRLHVKLINLLDQSWHLGY